MRQITADASEVHLVVTLTRGCGRIPFKINNRITAQAIGLEHRRVDVPGDFYFILLACLAGLTAVASDEN